VGEIRFGKDWVAGQVVPLKPKGDPLMSDNFSSERDGPSGEGAPRRRRRWLIPAALVAAAAAAGAAASQAAGGHGPGYWRGRGFMHGEFDPARAEDRAHRMIRHLAVEIDATREQEEKLRALARSAVKDLLPMREQARAARERARGLLVQQTVDRAAIEAFRTEQMALMDAASRRLAQALADAAEVLTPEQRQKLDERLTELREHRGFWRPWHRG
jgi:Spy/CpxP family protein refolding chaperone